jgi:hypothetical protein
MDAARGTGGAAAGMRVADDEGDVENPRAHATKPTRPQSHGLYPSRREVANSRLVAVAPGSRKY